MGLSYEPRGRRHTPLVVRVTGEGAEGIGAGPEPIIVVPEVRMGF